MRIENKFNPILVLESLSPPISPENLIGSWSKVTSLMVVRHPLDRLVSLYNNKFIHRVTSNELWTAYASSIKENYRDRNGDNSENITPEEMIR
jgi:hypothetical protein